MEISVAEQTWTFLASIALGAVLGACYDVFRILRIAVPHSSAAVMVEDILFFALCAAATFCFLLTVGDGQLRAFIIIGEGIGGILYYCTVGALVIRISKWIIAAIKSVLNVIWHWLIRPIFVLLQKIMEIFLKLLRFAEKTMKGKMKKAKTHLKKHHQVLYNLKNGVLPKRRKTKSETRSKKRSEKRYEKK